MRLDEQTVKDAGDTVAGVLTLGVITEVVPVILGVLGIAWFALRFLNFLRVNFYGKEPWHFS